MIDKLKQLTNTSIIDLVKQYWVIIAVVLFLIIGSIAYGRQAWDTFSSIKNMSSVYKSEITRLESDYKADKEAFENQISLLETELTKMQAKYNTLQKKIADLEVEADNIEQPRTKDELKNRFNRLGVVIR